MKPWEAIVADENTTRADAARRREAERLARLMDRNADAVLAHLIEMERKGLIQLREKVQ